MGHPKTHKTTHICSLLTIILITSFSPLISSQSSLCRTSCGGIPIRYPLSIDDGCGSPYYRHILVCSEPANVLELWTPSGRYPVKSISYTDPHILISDPLMWSCQDGDRLRPTRALSLDTSIHLSLSSQNEYLFFNCSPDRVIMEPRPMFCERFPERCDASCDPSSYLCRHLPQCGPNALRGTSCCSYYPKATVSLRMMLKHCTTYTTIHWKSVGGLGTRRPYDQVPEYGVRVDFDIPVTSRCLRCQDRAKGGGTCGFETRNQDFLCLCEQGNVTTYCKDHQSTVHSGNTGAIAGTVTVASVAGGVGIGAGIWYLKKVRAKEPVTHGVQTNENRLF
uniref:Wall-associated receptor kinase galacturonan-binding domain-containing protein n=1 Tax=Opuntia streptacantha TaxID=393608 RepID=A0A7C8Z3B5_OPUST